MESSAKFWDKIAPSYAKQPISDEAAYQTKLKKTREYFTPESNVLEFGCGTGSTAVKHAPFVKHYHAIDISEKMLSFGRDQAEAANLENLSFEQATIESFQAQDASFDAILGMSILHLLEDPSTTMEKVSGLLKPGGVFVSSTVCIAETQPWLKLILPFLRLIGKAPFVQSLKINQIEALMTNAGLTIEHKWLASKEMVVFMVARKPS